MLSDFGQGREEARAIKPTFYFFLSSTTYRAITRTTTLLYYVAFLLLLPPKLFYTLFITAIPRTWKPTRKVSRISYSFFFYSFSFSLKISIWCIRLLLHHDNGSIIVYDNSVNVREILNSSDYSR